jgi:secreted Zn-dependent insulinase-like peptidase
MIVFGAIKDQNVISFVYTFPPSNDRIWNHSMQLVLDLFQHEGKGSLYSLLKEQGLIESIHPQDSLSFRSVIHTFYLELRLTD